MKKGNLKDYTLFFYYEFVQILWPLNRIVLKDKLDYKKKKRIHSFLDENNILYIYNNNESRNQLFIQTLYSRAFKIILWAKPRKPFSFV